MVSSRLRRINFAGLAVILGAIGVWELYARTLGADLDSTATTHEIARALKDLAFGGPLLGQLGHTLVATLTAWVIASAIGLGIGLAVGLFKPVWKFSMASIDLLRAIPSVCFVPIAILYFGFSSKMEMSIAIYVATWPVLLMTLGGILAVPASSMDIATTMRLGRWATVRKIVLPSALSSVMVGLRLGLTLSVALVVVAEMLGNPNGLGFGIVFAEQSFHPDEVFAYLLVIGILGWALNAVFVGVVNRLVPTQSGGVA
jgi:NitT/TauT family transport system permease protein